MTNDTVTQPANSAPVNGTEENRLVWAEWLVTILFLWYVFFSGLSKKMPGYMVLDDLIFAVMLVSALLKMMAGSFQYVPNKKVAVMSSLLFFSVILSMLVTRGEIGLTIKFLYIIFRPLIILFFIIIFNIRVDKTLDLFCKIALILIMINLPKILFLIAKNNIKVLTIPAFHDSVGGFFPLQNNDSLTFLYGLLLCKYFYEQFWLHQNRKKYLCYFFFLLIFTMNLKYIFLLTVFFSITLLLQSKRKLKIFLITMLSFTLLIQILWTTLKTYLMGLGNIPIVIMTFFILNGEVKEHNLLFGTGPGTFTSPIAIDAGSTLSQKYGIQFLQKYFKGFKKSNKPTGTFTRLTSSFLTLLGDSGILSVLLYLIFLIILITAHINLISASLASFMGFVFGSLCFTLGFFMDYWFWGADIFILMLACKKVFSRERLGPSSLPSLDQITAIPSAARGLP